jgi:hypothetical protein
LVHYHVDWIPRYPVCHLHVMSCKFSNEIYHLKWNNEQLWSVIFSIDWSNFLNTTTYVLIRLYIYHRKRERKKTFFFFFRFDIDTLFEKRMKHTEIHGIYLCINIEN